MRGLPFLLNQDNLRCHTVSFKCPDLDGAPQIYGGTFFQRVQPALEPSGDEVLDLRGV